MTTTQQHKIGSGFSADTTAREVLKGIDLSGQLALVTGGYSGLGLETTRALAEVGARVVVPARRPDAARAVLGDLPDVEIAHLDLADQHSIRVFANDFLASDRTIDLLIANAGIMACPQRRIGPDWESQFAINHLGHYALVNRLWPALTNNNGTRIVSVSSAGHHFSAIRWDDVQFTREYDKWLAYGQAKTANVLFAVQLDTIGRDLGIRAFSLHPGAILTPLQRYLGTEEMVELGWIDHTGTPADSSFKTPAQGAATQIWAATSPQLAGRGGLYCEDCDVAQPAIDTDGSESEAFVGVRDYAIDPEHAARLWNLSAQLTGLDCTT